MLFAIFCLTPLGDSIKSLNLRVPACELRTSMQNETGNVICPLRLEEDAIHLRLAHFCYSMLSLGDDGALYLCKGSPAPNGRNTISARSLTTCRCSSVSAAIKSTFQIRFFEVL